MVWHGMAWYGMVWYGIVWYSLDTQLVHVCLPGLKNVICVVARVKETQDFC